MIQWCTEKLFCAIECFMEIKVWPIKHSVSLCSIKHSKSLWSAHASHSIYIMYMVCIRVYACVHVFVVYRYVCLCLLLYMCVCVCTNTSICSCVYTGVLVDNIYMCLGCISVCVCIYICICFDGSADNIEPSLSLSMALLAHPLLCFTLPSKLHSHHHASHYSDQ